MALNLSKHAIIEVDPETIKAMVREVIEGASRNQRKNQARLQTWRKIAKQRKEVLRWKN